MKKVYYLTTLKCNLKCFYCKQNHSLGSNRIPPELNNELGKLGVIDTFAITGGEPLLMENLAEFINSLNAKMIILFTNATLVTSKFIDTIKDKNLHFHITYHYAGVDLGDFIIKTSMIGEKFRVGIRAVLHPSLTEDFIKKVSDSIPLQWKSYIGVYQDIRYPNKEYVNRYKEYLKEIDNKIINNQCQISWRGKKCTAGKDIIFIFYNGDVYRCNTLLDRTLGNIFSGEYKLLDEAEECPADICKCYHQGQMYAENN